jgi:hypothetical protein
MIWSILLLIGAIAFIVWHLLSKLSKEHYAANLRKNIHPSDALIELCLPLEILEYILSLTDPPSFMTCRFVNKFWHGTTSNSILEHNIITHYQALSRQSIASLLKSELKIDMKSEDFLSYTEAYPKGLILRDIAEAYANDKILLALEEDSIERLAFEVFSTGYNQAFLRKLKDTFWIKTMANNTYLSRPVAKKLEVHWRGRYFRLNDGGKILSRVDELARYSGPADIMISPKALEGLFGRAMEILMYRPRLTSKFLLGVIPQASAVDMSYFGLLTLIPCLIHDVAIERCSDPSKSSIFVLISGVGLLITMLFLYLGTTRSRFGVAVEMGHWICIATLWMFSYNFYANFLAFLGSAAVVGAYITLLFSYTQVWPMTSKRIPSVIFFVTLLTLANDWSRTISAIRDGIIYQTFAKWFLSYLMVIANIFAMYFVTQSWQYKSEMKIIAALLFMFVIVMTVYFPN